MKKLNALIATSINKGLLLSYLIGVVGCDLEQQIYAHSCFQIDNVDSVPKLVAVIENKINVPFVDVTARYSQRQQDAGMAQFYGTTDANLRILVSKHELGDTRICLYDYETENAKEDADILSPKIRSTLEKHYPDLKVIKTKPEKHLNTHR